jgi:hypothetical protein
MHRNGSFSRLGPLSVSSVCRDLLWTGHKRHHRSIHDLLIRSFRVNKATKTTEKKRFCHGTDLDLLGAPTPAKKKEGIT